jgi:ubiquinone/menaquinone biosynthesis C-methylase UbiE
MENKKMPRIVDKLDKKTKIIAGELEGWDKFAKDEGWLNPPDDYILYLPKPKQKVEGDTLNWHIHAENFFSAIKGINFKNKTVLDIAAGRTWTSKELALRGAKVTATDILVKDGIGLKTAYRYFKKFNVRYNLVRCDMNNLPFKESSFDIVFVHASIHHSEDIKKAITEMKRVCKNKGLIIFSGEPVGNFYGWLLNRFRIKGLQYKIHETTPQLREYIKHFNKKDLKRIPAKDLGWRNYFNILPIFGGTIILKVRNNKGA